MIVTGILYNKNFLRDEFFLLFLEKLWNVVENVFNVKILTRLITTCASKITKNGMAKVAKNYLDNLVTYQHSFGNANERQELLNEVLMALKLLYERNQEVKIATTSSQKFQNILAVMKNENFKQIVQNLKTIFPVKKSEMIKIVEIFIESVILKNQNFLFVKLAEKLRNGLSVDDKTFTFKFYLEEKLKSELKICIENEQKMANVFKWTSLIGDLFLSNVVSMQLIASAFEVLFEKEMNDKRIVEAIGMLMKKVKKSFIKKNGLIKF